ncbi:type III secretion system cytoplasmic ring protein SctQ [Burkholderia sp. 3C]
MADFLTATTSDDPASAPDAQAPHVAPPARPTPAASAAPATTATQAAIARAVPRRVDVGLARLSQTAHDARLAPAVLAATGARVLRIAPIVGPGAARGTLRDPAVLELALAAPGGAARPVFVEFDLDAHPALAILAWPDRTGVPGAPAMLSPSGAELALRQTVAGVLLEPLAAALGKMGFDTPRVVSVMRRPLADCLADAKLDLPPMALSIALGETRIDCTVAATSAVLGTLDALIARTAGDAWRTAFPALNLPGSAIVGTRHFAVETLSALEPGDVLLRCLFPTFDAAALHGGGAPRVVAAWGARGHLRAHAGASLDGRTLTLTQEWTMSDELDSTRADVGLATDRPDEPIVVGNLELPVQFEIDTVALPLDQLSALGPGYVVELPVPAADAQLRLVVHGQTVGFGELVTVGEHLGVRIIRMAHRHGSVQ